MLYPVELQLLYRDSGNRKIPSRVAGAEGNVRPFPPLTRENCRTAPNLFLPLAEATGRAFLPSGTHPIP